MKLNAIGVTSSNLTKTVEFYKLIGFRFPEFKADEQHAETLPEVGAPKLMIDTKELITSILGEEPFPANHSTFAVEFENAGEVDKIADELFNAGFKVEKTPWDAFWGQRYCIVEDPDGYKVDLYAELKREDIV
jgi:catechol 2,3-dioxygenase-like lactoylglutathione lyase family enzyme